MSSKKIEREEVERYWEIFSTLASGGKYLSGAQAASVLKNSRLRDDQLERVWDLADVDNDGNLDFEEFCVAMRIIFDLVNGEYADVPTSLPDWLIPESKAHLVQANRALAGTQPSFPPVEHSDPSDSDDAPGLSDSFDWYMSPADISRYESIYVANKTPKGLLAFNALEPLYSSLDVPDTDLRSAWNLVNPTQQPAISKHAALTFLHILNSRDSGIRIPRSIPASLRASFQESKINYQLDRITDPPHHFEDTSTNRKAKFGDAYLSRLGIGGKGRYTPAGTDFSSTVIPDDWEAVRLKQELQEITEKIERIEASAASRRGGGKRGGRRREDDSKPALVKRELEQLLDYKRKEVRELESGEGRTKDGAGLKSIEGEIKGLRELVNGLETHWRKREEVLEGLRREVQEEKKR